MLLSSVQSRVCYNAIFSRKQNVLCCYLQSKARCDTLLMLSSVESKTCYVAIFSRKQGVIYCYLTSYDIIFSRILCHVDIFSRKQSVLCCCLQQKTNCVMKLNFSRRQGRCAFYVAIFSRKQSVLCCYLQQKAVCYVAFFIKSIMLLSVERKVQYFAILSRK